MKARVGAWTFRIVEVARPGLGSLSFGLSLSLSRTLSIAYRRHGSRISAWRRMAVVRTAYAARRERESSPAFDDPVWHPRALRGGGAVGNALTRESQAHLERNGAVLLLVRHGRTGSGSAVGASGSGWSAPPRVTCCTATYSRGARCHGLNRLGVFRIYIHIYVHPGLPLRTAGRPSAAVRCPIPQTRVSARRYIRRYTPSTRLNVTPHRIESPTHRESRRHSSGP